MAGAFFELDAQADQEEVRQETLCHLMMPATPGTRLVMIHANLAFAFFDGRFNGPTQAGQSHQLGLSAGDRCITQKRFQFWLRAETATKDRPPP